MYGLVRLDDGVARDEGGADRDQHGALGLGLDDLQGVQLGLGTGLGGLARPKLLRLAALRRRVAAAFWAVALRCVAV